MTRRALTITATLAAIIAAPLYITHTLLTAITRGDLEPDDDWDDEDDDTPMSQRTAPMSFGPIQWEPHTKVTGRCANSPGRDQCSRKEH